MELRIWGLSGTWGHFLQERFAKVLINSELFKFVFGAKCACNYFVSTLCIAGAVLESWLH